MSGSPAVKKLILKIPGSTSNIGPGLDTFALALGLYTRLTCTLLEREDPSIPFVTLKGTISRTSQPADADALTDRVMRKLWRDSPDLVKRVRLTIDSQIPLGAGLGSSDATIIGAMYAEYAFRDIVPTPAELLAESATLEGHGESIAASLLGGFVVCMKSADGKRLVARRHEWPAKWKTLLVVPHYSARTIDARAVLPDTVSLGDAMANLQHSAMLLSAVTTSNDLALKEALEDRLHEPFRHDIAPLLAPVRRALVNEPVLGTVLSGAGPSILVIVHEKHLEQIVEKLKLWASEIPDPPAILDVPVDTEGLKELGHPGRPRSAN